MCVIVSVHENAHYRTKINEAMKKVVKYISLDVYKDSITNAIADQGSSGEVQVYGKNAYDLNQIDKIMRSCIVFTRPVHVPILPTSDKQRD